MDFEAEVPYSPEQEEFAKEVRAWIKENVPKGVFGNRDPVKITHEQWLQRRELGRKLGQKGWIYSRYPKQYGGAALSADLAYVLTREFSEVGVSLPPYHDAGGSLGAAAILAVGTEEQKKKFLPPIIRGEVATWELFTEPEAGTDEANQQTNALRVTKEGEYFKINGGKIFVGGLWEPPEQFLLLTRSDLNAPRHQNLAMFIAPARVPGVTITRLDLFVPGIYSSVCGQTTDVAEAMKYQVFFDDVKIHESCLVCNDHDGWKVAQATLFVEHGLGDRTGTRAAKARSTWIPKHVVAEKFLAQCRKNRTVNKRLRENPMLLQHVIDTYTDYQVERLLHIRNAGGKGGAYGGPQQQVFTKLFSLRLSQHMDAVLGPRSLTDDPRLWLDEAIFEVAHRGAIATAPAGTPEAMRIVISRGLNIGR